MAWLGIIICASILAFHVIFWISAVCMFVFDMGNYN